MNKVIFICPAGRQKCLEIQLLYMKNLLDLDIVFEYHIWDFAWSKEDSDYISNLPLIHSKIKIKKSPYTNAKRGNGIASKQFAYFLHDFYKFEEYKNYIFIKLDDDVCFIDTKNFTKFVDGRKKSSAFLYSANIINNDHNEKHNFDKIHSEFLSDYKAILEKNNTKENEIFSNEKRLSINFVSFMGHDLKFINEHFSNGKGSNDEWRLCHIIPKQLQRQNEICLYMTVVHYAFGGIINDKYLNPYNNVFNQSHRPLARRLQRKNDHEPARLRRGAPAPRVRLRRGGPAPRRPLNQLK